VYIYVHIELYTCTCIHAAHTYKTFRAVVEYKIPEEERRRGERQRGRNERKGAQGQGMNGIYICGQSRRGNEV
jgi:hypothetical protein